MFYYSDKKMFVKDESKKTVGPAILRVLPLLLLSWYRDNVQF